MPKKEEVKQPKTFGERLRESREEKGYTQRQLAKELNISEPLISRWENGRAFPTTDTLPKLRNALGVSIDSLLGFSEQGKSFSLLNCLCSVEQTERYENTAQVIWTITPDFRWMWSDRGWHDLIYTNIVTRHVKNYVLYMQTEETTNFVKLLEDEYKEALDENWDNLLRLVPGTMDEFPGWAEHVLYDPLDENPQNRHCIMVLTQEFHYNGIIYNFEFAKQMRDRFTNWFKTNWNRNPKAIAKDWQIP